MKTKFAWLLLVGWALMVPINNDADNVNGTPNLKTWFHNGSFDTALECENAAGRRYQKAEADHKERDALSLVFAKCIPMDLIYKVKP
jgi:hypothetical protein